MNMSILCTRHRGECSLILDQHAISKEGMVILRLDDVSWGRQLLCYTVGATHITRMECEKCGCPFIAGRVAAGALNSTASNESFMASCPLPQDADTSTARATLADGMLCITMRRNV